MEPLHRIRIHTDHGTVSDLHRPVCACGWIGSDQKDPRLAVEEGKRHLRDEPEPQAPPHHWARPT